MRRTLLYLNVRTHKRSHQTGIPLDLTVPYTHFRENSISSTHEYLQRTPRAAQITSNRKKRNLGKTFPPLHYGFIPLQGWFQINSSLQMKSSTNQVTPGERWRGGCNYASTAETDITKIFIILLKYVARRVCSQPLYYIELKVVKFRYALGGLVPDLNYQHKHDHGTVEPSAYLKRLQGCFETIRFWAWKTFKTVSSFNCLPIKYSADFGWEDIARIPRYHDRLSQCRWAHLPTVHEVYKPA